MPEKREDILDINKIDNNQFMLQFNQNMYAYYCYVCMTCKKLIVDKLSYCHQSDDKICAKCILRIWEIEKRVNLKKTKSLEEFYEKKCNIFEDEIKLASEIIDKMDNYEKYEKELQKVIFRENNDMYKA